MTIGIRTTRSSPLRFLDFFRALLEAFGFLFDAWGGFSICFLVALDSSAGFFFPSSMSGLDKAISFSASRTRSDFRSGYVTSNLVISSK
jgi:hypothetical protein